MRVLNDLEVLKSYIEVPIWDYTIEILLYLFLIAVPYSLIEWTRITLLLIDKIYFSTIVHVFVLVALGSAYLAGTSLASFLTVYGGLISVIFYFYRKHIFENLRKI